MAREAGISQAILHHDVADKRESLQLTFDRTAFGVARAARFCEAALVPFPAG